MKTMRPQRVVLPLAFLSAAFMLGCQDQGLEPVGPEGLAPLFDPGGAGKGGPNKKGGSVLADLTLGTGEPATGLVTSTSQEVGFKDGQAKIELERACGKNCPEGIKLAFNLTETHADGAGFGLCEAGGPGVPDDVDVQLHLFDLLVGQMGVFKERNSLFVSIDKTALDLDEDGSGTGSSEDHVINITWRVLESDGTTTARQLIVGTLPKFPDEDATVSVTGDINDVLTVVFTGGSIILRFTQARKRDGVRDTFSLTCPLHVKDAITMVLVATPSS